MENVKDKLCYTEKRSDPSIQRTSLCAEVTMGINKKDVHDARDLREYILATTKKNERLYHYTTYENLLYILRDRCLRLTRCDRMNDRAEVRNFDGERESAYILSFSNSAREYVSMWAMYGKPGGVKIRIDFPSESLAVGDGGQLYYDTELTRAVPENNLRRAGCVGEEADFSLSDVVYLDRKNNRLNHNARPFENLVPNPELIRDFRGFIKFSAWEFEKETRLCVLLNKPGPDYLYLRLNPNLVRDLGVTYNPWIGSLLRDEAEESLDRLAGCRLLHADSENRGEIGEWIPGIL